MSGEAAARLIDWDTAAQVGKRFSGAVPETTRAERARMAEDLAEAAREADALVSDLTGLRTDGPRSRAWAMTRGEWVQQNLRGFEVVLDRVGRRVLERGRDGAFGAVRRRVVGFQLGAILGYLSRKVLGQYDLFLPPDDRDLIYFIGPNLIELERKHRFDPGEFRLWLALHEVTHRLQFEGVPWLRTHVTGMIDAYLDALELDPRKLLERLRRARSELSGGTDWREMGVFAVLMSAEQRETFRRMQALMSLLEGHGNYVMTRLSEGRIETADRMRRTLQQRRQGMNRTVQRTIGLDVKVRQYDQGERFVTEAVDRAGDEGFARIWERPEHLPTLDEIQRPEAWVERVAGG